MRVNVNDIPNEVINEYGLREHNLIHDGFVYVEIRKALFGLKQSGALANKQLSKVINKIGYHHSKHTPGLWLHEPRDILFILVVDDFGVKYTNKDDVLYLKAFIETAYPVTTNWEGNRFIGVYLNWDYSRRELKASMPNYVTRALLQFQHETPGRIQYEPSKYTPPIFGAKGPQMMDIDNTKRFTKEEAKWLQ